jgi:hypothetical protein
MRMSILKMEVIRRIPNNEIDRDTPYTIMVSTSGPSMGSVTLAVVQTDGVNVPPRIDVRCHSCIRIVQKWGNVHVGSTSRCAFERSLPEIIALRDAMNVIHRIKVRKHPVTEELMQSVTDPKLKKELIEACCMRAL